MIMHLVPFTAFDARLALPLANIQWYHTFPPMGSAHVQQTRINVDGLLTLPNPDVRATAQRAYVQVFHSGIIEAVGIGSTVIDGDGTPRNPLRLHLTRCDVTIIKYSHIYL